MLEPCVIVGLIPAPELTAELLTTLQEVEPQQTRRVSPPHCQLQCDFCTVSRENLAIVAMQVAENFLTLTIF